MHHFTHKDVTSKLRDLYLSIVDLNNRFPIKYPNLHSQFSAQNLISFLVYKQNMDSTLMMALKDRGFQLSSIQQVLKSLQIMCFNWGINSFTIFYDHPPVNTLWLAKKRKETVLGKNPNKNTPHIMVTLDAKMKASISTIEKFLLNGMSIARINCSYDDTSTWKELIEAVRHTEEKLRRAGKYKNRYCKIYMDLAGPKIRIGPIKKAAFPLKINVKKDPFGRPLEFKQGFISLHSPITQRLKDSMYDFIISATSNDALHPLKEGDFLYFHDIRNKRRKFIITGITANGLMVGINESSYLDENTKLHNDNYHIELHVNNLEKTPIPIYVKKGEYLNLYLDEQQKGHPASGTMIAGVPITLAAAFSNIKPNDSVYIDDGKIQGVVKERGMDFVKIQITSPDSYVKLKENKGINLPDSNVGLTVPALTDKDKKDLAFISQNADIVGLSFVHHPRDLQELRQLLRFHKKKDLPVIAKIETKEAIHSFSNLLLEGLNFPNFGVMIARGDLAIEIGFQQLSVVQEEILPMCRAAHVPVILATQVLETLAQKGIPSRSELADLSFGSEFDCLMLNKGPYMEETVKFLTTTLQLISQVKDYKQAITRPSVP